MATEDCRIQRDLVTRPVTRCLGRSVWTCGRTTCSRSSEKSRVGRSEQPAATEVGEPDFRQLERHWLIAQTG
jgi:hypothetical protein